MKTNASEKTIRKAVSIVSREKYGDNILFRTAPQNLTKNVIRFTLRAKDKNKAGAYKHPETGLKQPKVNQQVYLDVLDQIFKIENRADVYGDTMFGRQYNPNKDAIKEIEDSKTAHKPKAAKRGRKPLAIVAAKITKHSKKAEKNLSNRAKRFIETMSYIMNNKELLGTSS